MCVTNKANIEILNLNSANIFFLEIRSSIRVTFVSYATIRFHVMKINLQTRNLLKQKQDRPHSPHIQPTLFTYNKSVVCKLKVG